MMCKKMVQDETVCKSVSDFLEVLLDMQQAHLIDVILVTSEPDTISVLQSTVSGARARLQIELLSWWPSSDLIEPVSLFL